MVISARVPVQTLACMEGMQGPFVLSAFLLELLPKELQGVQVRTAYRDAACPVPSQGPKQRKTKEK